MSMQYTYRRKRACCLTCDEQLRYFVGCSLAKLHTGCYIADAGPTVLVRRGTVYTQWAL